MVKKACLDKRSHNHVVHFPEHSRVEVTMAKYLLRCLVVSRLQHLHKYTTHCQLSNSGTEFAYRRMVLTYMDSWFSQPSGFRGKRLGNVDRMDVKAPYAESLHKCKDGYV